MNPTTQSVVLIPVLDALPVVGDLRLQCDPSAQAGIPPHLTLLFPFVPPADLTQPVLNALEALFRLVSPFEYSLPSVAEFEQGVVYLEPRPEEPFRRLTAQMSHEFGLRPFEGAFPEVIPHLTVALLESAAGRRDLTGLYNLCCRYAAGRTKRG